MAPFIDSGLQWKKSLDSSNEWKGRGGVLGLKGSDIRDALFGRFPRGIFCFTNTFFKNVSNFFLTGTLGRVTTVQKGMLCLCNVEKKKKKKKKKKNNKKEQDKGTLLTLLGPSK